VGAVNANYPMFCDQGPDPYQLLLGEDHPDVRAGVDALGLGRAPQEYRHAILCEHPPRPAHRLAPGRGDSPP
jgi:hypothetical protein